MKGRYLVFLVWIGFLFVGCAGAELAGGPPGPQVGQTEADLVAQLGEPQKIQPAPEGGKIFIYSRERMARTAILSGGAWSKPEQTYYYLDAQGKIYKASFYPYGKRKFIFPTEEAAPAQVAQAQPPTTSSTSSLAAPVESSTSPPPSSKAPVTRDAEPAAPSSSGREASSRLELGMSKAQVRGLLGLPDRSEAFHLQGKPVIIWYYYLEEGQGRKVITPLVFMENRLSGWGETYYRRVLKEAGPGLPK